MRRLRSIGWGALLGLAVVVWASHLPPIRMGIGVGLGVLLGGRRLCGRAWDQLRRTVRRAAA